MHGKHDDFPVLQLAPDSSMLALNVSAPGPHLEARDFQSLWTTGFPESRWRHRVLDHLVRGCEVCLEGLRGPVPDLPEESPKAVDPVVHAFWRLATFFHQGGRATRDLRSIHRLALSLAAEGRPSAFARLVLEEAFLCGRSHRSASVWEEMASAAFRGIEAVADSAVVGSRKYDLRALARLYLAEARQVEEGPDGVAVLLAEALAILRSGGSGREVLRALERGGLGWIETLDRAVAQPEEGTREGLEIVAAFLERRAELDAVRWVHWQAFDRLGQAAEILNRLALGDRWSECALRWARKLLHVGHRHKARPLLTKAAAELTTAAPPWLRLEIVHHRAALEAEEGDYHQVLGRLTEARSLYAEHASPVMAMQRLLLLGRTYLVSRNHQLAVESFRTAFEGFFNLGRDEEALHALEGLLRVNFLLFRPPEELLDLRPRIHRLLGTTAGLRLARETLAGLVAEGQRKGWAVEQLEAWLEQPPPGGVN